VGQKSIERTIRIKVSFFEILHVLTFADPGGSKNRTPWNTCNYWVFEKSSL